MPLTRPIPDWILFSHGPSRSEVEGRAGGKGGVLAGPKWPMVAHLLADYASAIAPWVGHAQVLPEDRFRRRWEACGACPLWRGEDVARCADVRRQCEKLRLWMASETCLQERWKTL